MAALKVSRLKFRSFLGGMLLLLGSAILLLDLGALAVRVQRFFNTSGGETVGILSALGSSFLHTLQAVAFHEFDYFSLILPILVSFSALVAAGAGALLLRTRPVRGAGEDQVDSAGFFEGDR
jgi:hypothetical protein